ncbi:MAG: RidA family protein [Gammaproteobacteria bacterium]|nr:RidA family protein [Gammaproteobacteria bacterium]MDE0414926.1 RidA family protein [Gammaproteobacteria bacterium]MDE0454529.1 RidA family protein [Gammaproteobacteria bacterium]
MQRTPVHTSRAPAAIGSYSQAIVAGGFCYVSGQIPLDPETGEMVEGDIGAQIRQVFDNLAAVARAAGCDLGRDAVKITVFLVDLAHFGLVNEVMSGMFAQPFPARAAIEVAGLPRGAQVEADAILVVP